MAGPGGSDLLRQIGVSPASAQDAKQTQSGHPMALFTKVLAEVSDDYVEPVSERTLIDHALDGMLQGLDPHSSYMTEPQWQQMQTETSGRFGGVGLQVVKQGNFIRVVSPLDGTPAALAGMKPGDLITAINGKTVDGLDLNAAVADMRGPPETSLLLTVMRQDQDQPLTFNLTRQIIHVQTVTSRLMGTVGVLRISEFTAQTDAGVHTAMQRLRKEAKGKLSGIVLDLRNDPGGLLDQAVAVANDFLDQGGIVSTRGRHPEDDQRWSAEPGKNLAGSLPIVVLTNNGTASASEIVAGALKDDRRALVLGTRTFGKGSVQTLMPLDGDGAIRLTTARYYSPSGRSIQGKGIAPDVEIDATRNPMPHFGPEHEADLQHIISNEGGQEPTLPAPVALPEVASHLPQRPPPDWPAFDPDKPSTDFQLQQALVLVHAMAGNQT